MPATTGNDHPACRLAEAGRLRATLPWPPSVNHYWRAVGGRIMLSKAGRQYHRDVAAALFGQGRLADDARLAVRLGVFPPDRRRRDLDNVAACGAGRPAIGRHLPRRFPNRPFRNPPWPRPAGRKG